MYIKQYNIRSFETDIELLKVVTCVLLITKLDTTEFLNIYYADIYTFSNFLSVHIIIGSLK